jgi:alkanesulfonate monooxygenase SsuD/methylene tetrahydromethanopterin reductase-like flavin-dependent oxidoreductase (luciferase family)
MLRATARVLRDAGYGEEGAMATGRPYKLGIILPEAEFDMGGQTARWHDLAAMARLAEEMGFDSVWFVDHLIYRDDLTTLEQQGVWECWSVLAALAAVTERVELGSLVTPTSFRNPALFAKIVDTVEEISSGRVILGLGAGYHAPEYRAFGFPHDHRASRFEEAFTIIRTLLREGRIDFEGTYYSARECELRPRGPRPNGPPIMIGSKGPRMLRITLPHVELWNAWLSGSRSHPDQVPPLRALVDDACREVGRDPATVERTVSIMVDQTGTRAIGPSMHPDTAEPLTGSPEEIAAGIRAFAAQGISHLQMYLVPNTIQSIERFGRVLEVLSAEC